MDDSFSVIEIIEESESEELIKAAELVEIFECNSLPDNMEAIEVSEEIEIESKLPRVSEESEGTEDTETRSSFDKFMSSTWLSLFSLIFW